RRHTRFSRDWSSDVCSSDLAGNQIHNLALSVQARARGIAPDHPDFPADGYKGDYIADIAADFMAAATVQASDGEPVLGSANPDEIGSAAGRERQERRAVGRA